jgi:hypothetical protein
MKGSKNVKDLRLQRRKEISDAIESEYVLYF